MKYFTKITLAAVLLFSSLSMTPPASAQYEQGQPMYIPWVYAHTRLAVAESLAAQSVFNRARAENDEQVMQLAALRLIANLSDAVAWSGRLDEVVTTDQFNEEVVNAVADLHDLAMTAYDNVDEFVVSDDMAGLGQRLDQSSDTFNRLSNNFRSLNQLMEVETVTVPRR